MWWPGTFDGTFIGSGRPPKHLGSLVVNCPFLNLLTKQFPHTNYPRNVEIFPCLETPHIIGVEARDR